MNESVHPFLEKYTHPDGELIWGDTWKNSRDGGDDLYESSYNWPLLYLMGGGDHLLAQGQRLWDAITRVQPPVMLIHADTANKMLLEEVRRWRSPNAFVVGRMYKDQATQQAILDHCRRHGIWLVADDVYERLYYDDDAPAAAPVP